MDSRTKKDKETLFIAKNKKGKNYGKPWSPEET